MSAATGPAAGRMDLGPMRDQLQARIEVIEAEIAALEAERAELERVLGAMPSPAAVPERRRAGARRVTVGRPTADGRAGRAAGGAGARRAEGAR
jgi:hypothetical protein